MFPMTIIQAGFAVFAFPLRLAVLLALPMAACAAGQPLGPAAVLIAGDASLAVFDNAVSAMAQRVPGARVTRMSASPALLTSGAVLPATPDNILSVIAHMRPDPGQGCFIFATSHGAEGFGLVLGMTDEALDPRELDSALQQGCGRAPTALVLSGCFSGIYTLPPMTRPNRIILTAARPDRSSFGCRAGVTYTVYDKCLLDAVKVGGSWKNAYASIKRCVAFEERREHVTPSEPQAWFGPEVADMHLP